MSSQANGKDAGRLFAAYLLSSAGLLIALMLFLAPAMDEVLRGIRNETIYWFLASLIQAGLFSVIFSITFRVLSKERRIDGLRFFLCVWPVITIGQWVGSLATATYGSNALMRVTGVEEIVVFGPHIIGFIVICKLAQMRWVDAA